LLEQPMPAFLHIAQDSSGKRRIAVWTRSYAAVGPVPAR
jgi:hypothetical protein